MNKKSSTYIVNETDERWRKIRYSSIFSRSNFEKLLRNDDYSLFQETIKDYDKGGVGKYLITYSDFIQHIYKYMIKNYRNEYIFKNSLINQIIKDYGTKTTAIFNEFAVGNSIVDMALFNGISRAFEIKTELDTNKRLKNQLADYKKIFNQCYIVIHESHIQKYESFDSDSGIIALSIHRGQVKLTTVKEAKYNQRIDPHILIRCLRTSEYKELIKRYYGFLPEMNSFTAFDICEKMLVEIPSVHLSKLFIDIMKERRSNMGTVLRINKHIRQISLCLHLSEKDKDLVEYKLKQPIQI